MFRLPARIPVLLVVATSTALGQPPPSPPPPGSPPDLPPHGFEGGFVHQFGADIDDGGDFNVTRVRATFGTRNDLGPQVRLEFDYAYEYSRYDFSGSTGFGGLNPWTHINTFRFHPRLVNEINPQWSIYAGPMATFSSEDNADIDESFSAGGVFGFDYRYSDTLSLGVGLLVTTQLEDDELVFPVIRFDWKLNDRWTIRTGEFDLGSGGGAGLEFAWAPAEKWEIAFGGQYQSRRFRLNGSGIAPDGVGEELTYPLYAKFTWKLTPNAELSGFAGFVAGGRLLLENSEGNEVSEQNFDPAGYVGARFSVRF